MMSARERRLVKTLAFVRRENCDAKHHSRNRVLVFFFSAFSATHNGSSDSTYDSSSARGRDGRMDGCTGENRKSIKYHTNDVTKSFKLTLYEI